jgi:hypothetical protein
MTDMRKLKTVVAVAALAVASTSCGDVVRQGKSPMFLVIDKLTGGDKDTVPVRSDVLTKGSVFNDPGTVTLRVVPKNTTALPAPTTSNNAVTIRRYRVVYTRSDGHNVPGVDVPYAFDGGVTGTVAPGPAVSLVFDLVRHDAKLESPLASLVRNVIVLNTIAEVTFYGQDQVGNEISVTGLISIDFADFGDS